MRRRKILRRVKIALVIYALIGLLLYFLQGMILFQAKKLPEDYQYKFDVPFREVNLAVDEKKNISIVQFILADSTRKGIVLYFHGNRGNINRYAKFAKNFTSNGYEVWMIDYPGYGKSKGTRSEKILYEDALTFYKMANAQVPASQIIIYGKSLGTGIAAQLAMVRDCKRLILETPYYSMTAVASHYFFMYPVSPFLKYELPTHEYLEFVKAPVHIFHGTKDRVIPYNQSEKIKRSKPSVQLITIDGGHHNDLSDYPRFHQSLDSLLRL